MIVQVSFRLAYQYRSQCLAKDPKCPYNTGLAFSDHGNLIIAMNTSAQHSQSSKPSFKENDNLFSNNLCFSESVFYPLECQCVKAMSSFGKHICSKLM